MTDTPRSTPRRSLFYGYIVVTAAFFVMAISSGAIYSFSVFFAPLQAEFGWSRAMTSGVFSAYTVMQGLFAIATGRVNDRLGPRIILSICSLVFGLGFILMSRVDALWQLYVIYGVMIAAGFSGAPVPLMSTVAHWFRARRGLMTGLVMAGTGFGTMFVPPLSNWLISVIEWRASFVMVGVLLIVIVMAAAQFLRRDPAGMGLQPMGGESDPEQAASPTATRGLNFSEAVHTKQLWLLVAAMAGFGLALQSVMVHVVINATGHGLTPATAAGTMTAIGGMGVVGRVGVGGLADRLGSRRLLTLQFALLGTSLFGFAAAGSAWSIFACALLFGYAYGGIVPLYSHIVADLFGLRAHGEILGTITFTVGIGSAIGPIFTGYCYDVLGSYTVPFMTCGGVSAAAALLVCLVRPLAREFPGRSR